MNMARKTALIMLLVLASAGCGQQSSGRSYFASGVIRTDYPSGKARSEAAFKGNLLDGLSVSYYESGAKMSEAIYHSGLLDGKSTAYYENGNKKAEAGYKMGVLDGVSSNWSEGGALQNTVTFVDGRVEPEKKGKSDK